MYVSPLSKSLILTLTLTLMSAPNLVQGVECFTENRIVAISYFEDESRPPRVELFNLDPDLIFKNLDECQARLVLWHMKRNNGSSELINDPTTKRIVLKTTENDTEWLRQSAYMCSRGQMKCN